MKKTLIAASIAALAATSANAAVKIYESETGSLSSYGKIQLELENYDGENTIQNQSSRLGFAGDQELKHGLTGFANVEFRFDPGFEHDAGDEDGEWTVRNSYLGVKGDFGSIKAGNIDSIVYSMVTEQADIFENKGYRSLDEGKNNSRATSIVYETNDLNGFKLAANIKHYASDDSQYAPKDADVKNYASEKNVSAEVAYADLGGSLASADGKEQWNLQLGVTYQLNEELSFGLAFDQNNEDGNPSKETTDPIIAAKVNYATDQFGAGLVVEQTKDIIVTNLTGSYNYGAGDVYALVSFADVGKKATFGGKDGDKDDSGVDFGLGANYKLADNFKVYGEVAVGNDNVSGIRELSGKEDGTTAVTLGAAYKW